MKQRRVAVIGCGYVGLVTGACLAKLGHNVICVDKDQGKIDKLKRGEMPFFEPGLSELVGECKENLRFTTVTPFSAEFFFICVGTTDKSGDFGTGDFWECIRNLKVRHSAVVVIKSTVMPGTCRRVFTDGTVVLSNPEFLAEGTAIENTLNPDRIVIGYGGSDKSQAAVLELGDLLRLIPDVTFIMSWESAEMVKLASNAHLAARISLTNEIAMVCSSVGATIDDVMDAVGCDKRIGPHFLKAGVGYGGSCFPKDMQALGDVAALKVLSTPMLGAIVATNNRVRRWPERQLRTVFGDGSWSGNLAVAIWGLSFKPGTSDTRQSPGVDLVKWLVKEGVFVATHDPMAKWSAPTHTTHHTKDPYLSILGADALVVMTDLDEYRNVDWENVKKLMRGDLVLDGRLVCDQNAVEAAGLEYYAPGRTADCY